MSSDSFTENISGQADLLPGKQKFSHSSLVAAGVFASRIMGFVRQRVFGHYLGISDAADIFNAAFRIPNFLQNLFGEGALSASFIPVYARLRAEGRDKEADAVARLRCRDRAHPRLGGHGGSLRRRFWFNS